MLKQTPAHKFPSELKRFKYEIEDHARSYGLDFFPVIFEVLDYQEINEIAAYQGFPSRYPHWSFGMQFEEVSKSYAYGLSKIYEMVINNDPCYAYLLKCNNLIDQKLVMAHVYAHCDFFKNNLYFAPTNRKMIDEMANHATRVQRYVDRYGSQAVEAFIDCCLSLENLVDPHASFIKRREAEEKADRAFLKSLGSNHAPDPFHCGSNSPCAPGGCSPGPGGCSSSATPGKEPGGDLFADDEEEERVGPRRLKSKGYMERYVNPPDFLRSRAEELKAKRKEKKKFPESPEPDILLFLIENAPLKNWQRDILSIVREEAYYFVPQAQTKIMNEGWATYWHSRILTEKILKDSEVIDYADHHAGTLGGSKLHLNPYKLGVELFRDIEERWNKGRFGKEYEECDDLKARENWDKELGLGREKVFEVRRLHNDLTFIDTFLTEDFCRRQKLFVYGKDETGKAWVIQNREFSKIKKTFMDSLTNLGQPIVRAADGNFENRGELLLIHLHEGRDLKWDFSRDTLVNLHRLWKRPVHVETQKEGRKTRLTFDGKEHREKRLD
ncbi:MAG: SpoVR family protein [Syntrophaceae bacterium]|nr:SpoVR family protein [Syntrophaceae bacterium]